MYSTIEAELICSIFLRHVRIVPQGVLCFYVYHFFPPPNALFLSRGKRDIPFAAFGASVNLKRARTFLEGREKGRMRRDHRDGRGVSRQSASRDCDVGKTRNSLDPGSSRVAVVVHAINQPIDCLPCGRNFCPRRGHTGGKMEALRRMGD